MRSKAALILLATSLLIITSCAGSSRYMVRSTPVPAPQQGKSMVYFMRPSGMGFAVHFQIYDGNKLIGLSQAKSYFGYECEPGRHLFIGIAENKRAVEADLMAGKTYYIITQVKMGGWKARMAFIPVTRESEFWDKVVAWKGKLNYVEPKEEVITQWEDERKEKILREIAEITEYLKTPEGKGYVVTLGRDDGM